MGDRGTGKSVAVRSLVDLLPMIDIVADDPFNSSPTGEGCSSPSALWRRCGVGLLLPVIHVLVENPTRLPPVGFQRVRAGVSFSEPSCAAVEQAWPFTPPTPCAMPLQTPR